MDIVRGTYRIYSRMPSTLGLQLVFGWRRRLASTWNRVGHSLLEDSPLTKSSTLAKGITATLSFLSRQPSTFDHTSSAAENSKVGGFCTGRDRISSHLAIYNEWMDKGEITHLNSYRVQSSRRQVTLYDLLDLTSQELTYPNLNNTRSKLAQRWWWRSADVEQMKSRRCWTDLWRRRERLRTEDWMGTDRRSEGLTEPQKPFLWVLSYFIFYCSSFHLNFTVFAKQVNYYR